MLSMKKEELFKLMEVSKGKEPADLILRNGKIVNVYTREILSGYSVAVKGKWIVAVDRDLSSMIGPSTKCLDLEGKYLVPGFIDGHAHILPYCHPDEILKEAVKRGVTSIVTELLDLSFKAGIESMIKYLRATKGGFVKVFALVPPFITLSESARKRTPDLKEILRLLKREEVLGMGESFWQEVLREHPVFYSLLPHVSKMKKTLEGHAAGCRGDKLQAYVLTGVSSCHEPVTYEEILERLRLGLYAMVREGSVRSDLSSISPFTKSYLDTRRVILVSDFISPDDILEKGYMDYVVNRAIEIGIDPLTAIQMVTLNPATHFRLDDRLGAIAPGKYADLFVTSKIERIDPEIVISCGKLVVKEGELLFRLKRRPLNIEGLKRQKVSPKELLIKSEKPALRVRIINHITDLVTEEIVKEMEVLNGYLKPDPEKDIIRLSFVTEEGVYNYFIRGTGMREGAFATSSVWEAKGILAVGVDTDDMACAINRIIELGGGIVLAKNKGIVEELPLPIGSLISNLPFNEVAERLKSINRSAKEMGIRWKKPVISLEALSTPAIPFLRVSDRGLVNLKTGTVMSPLLD